MHRIGLMSKEELSTLLKLVDPDKFNVEGIFTHFATADGDDVAFEKQRSLFYEMIGNCKFKYIHCCNSASGTPTSLFRPCPSTLSLPSPFRNSRMTPGLP